MTKFRVHYTTSKLPGARRADVDANSSEEATKYAKRRLSKLYPDAGTIFVNKVKVVREKTS